VWWRGGSVIPAGESWRERVLGEHGGREGLESSGEHREHRAGWSGGAVVSQHGGQYSAGVTGGLREVLGGRGRGHGGRPGDGGQLEQVLSEGGIVVRDGGHGHPGEEGKVGHHVGEGGGQDVVTAPSVHLLPVILSVPT
jgi:hypothetical protein